MVKVYARLCEKGIKNFNDVPTELQDKVRSIIEEDGYYIQDNGTVSKLVK